MHLPPLLPQPLPLERLCGTRRRANGTRGWGARAPGVLVLRALVLGATLGGCMAFQDVEYSTDGVATSGEETRCDNGQRYCNNQTRVRNVCVDGRWEPDPPCEQGSVCVDALGCVECTPGEHECRENVLHLCGDQGSFAPEKDCSAEPVNKFCGADDCVECVDSSHRCTADGTAVLSCFKGKFTNSVPCDQTSLGCIDAPGDDDYCSECVTVGERRCLGDVQICAEDFTYKLLETCEHRCDSTGEGPHCAAAP